MDRDRHPRRGPAPTPRPGPRAIEVVPVAGPDQESGPRRWTDPTVAAHRRRRAGFLAAGIVAVAVVVVGLLGMADDGASTGRERVKTDTALKDHRGPTERSAYQSRVLNALPNSPIDAKNSWRLPVVVKPQTGVRDGDTITVFGRGFGANQSLGIVMCSSEADTANAGVGACELSSPGGQSTFDQVTYANSAEDGTVVAKFKVRRYIDTPEGGRIDCMSVAERCLVGMGAVSNYDQSGGSYVDFEGAPPFADPSLALSEPGPYASGQQVQAVATNLVPERQARFLECRGEQCHTLINSKADDAGTFTAAVNLTRDFTTVDGQAVTCEDKCEVRVEGIGVNGGTSAPVPDPVTIAFTDQTVEFTPETTVPSTTAPEVAPGPEAPAPEVAPGPEAPAPEVAPGPEAPAPDPGNGTEPGFAPTTEVPPPPGTEPSTSNPGGGPVGPETTLPPTVTEAPSTTSTS